jgi:hypothetical protein
MCGYHKQLGLEAACDVYLTQAARTIETACDVCLS